MGRVSKISQMTLKRAIYEVDQARLEKAEAELDKVIDRLLDDPGNEALNDLRRELELKIITYTGEKILDFNSSEFNSK